MPTFDTPEPITAVIDFATGSVRVSASERTDTVVTVHPSDPTDVTDVEAAENTRIDFVAGRLVIKGPKQKTWSWTSWMSWGGSIEVHVELPDGSRVESTGNGDFRGDGRLGEARLSSTMGDIWLEETGRLQLKTSHGNVSVTRCGGHTDVTTSNGEIDIREIDGTAVVKTSNGNITLGRVIGDARLNTAYGEITVGSALAGVGAKTAAGDVRIGEVVRGAVLLETGYGNLDLGIRLGTAAWLDVSSQYGDVQVALDEAEGPGDFTDTVEVRARTGYGDIAIHRA
ncbi:DUF4097 family beta strand repeat-containing protein [Nonomuraea sediminis]|uniref:DUF4097 family beta strand repeat-containing protein n=1 Tax=Nonomuraea sediminis TaxID=2835864 RepID=UPI001BDC990E|nr:DUF4097 family beta strand repeat-containing protein [Nonomuraea sediminis]